MPTNTGRRTPAKGSSVPRPRSGRSDRTEKEEAGKNPKIHNKKANNDHAERCRRTQVEERQQRDRQYPGQGRGGHAAVKIATPEYAEDQILDRAERQRVVWHAGLQQEWKHPKRRDRNRQYGDFISRIRIKKVKCSRHNVPDERSKDVAD